MELDGGRREGVPRREHNLVAACTNVRGREAFELAQAAIADHQGPHSLPLR